MERQTLQQQVPVYHVCQECGGDGCEACSDLCILDGDIHLDPEWVEELPSVTPINGVIGVKEYRRVARYNAGRNRLLTLRLLKNKLVNPDRYCSRCFLSKSVGAPCTRTSCKAAQ
ncbi:hypothetical protein [Aeromonas media]|uniref:hypothetical protein n=1 Tax=Aeromonas media TaxID=651 RepID=UPI0038CFD443